MHELLSPKTKPEDHETILFFNLFAYVRAQNKPFQRQLCKTCAAFFAAVVPRSAYPVLAASTEQAKSMFEDEFEIPKMFLEILGNFQNFPDHFGNAQNFIKFWKFVQ